MRSTILMAVAALVLLLMGIGVAACERTTLFGQGARSASNGDAGRLLWSAFECSAFAQTARKPQEAERLFLLGMEVGRPFIEAARAGVVAAEEIRTKVPIGITGRLSGPSTEFVLGRIFEAAQEEATNRIVKTDASGMPLPLADWVIDDELKQIKADTQYLIRNCAVIR